MGIARGTNIVRDGLVFGYDTGYGIANNNTATRFYPGETTENLIYDMGGTVTSSYPEVVYRCTANETNVVDTSAPGGKYSRFTGIDGNDNNQLYSRFSSYSIDVTGDSVNYSVYLKGSGTCHLTIYDNQSGYGTSSTITLTNEWVRYNYTRTVNASATSYWVAVRGVLNTTDVYIAGQQAMRGTHSTPYVEDNRSSTQSLIDLKRNLNIDVSSVSFDSTGQPTFDGTNDYIYIDEDILNVSNFTVEAIVNITSVGNYNKPIFTCGNLSSTGIWFLKHRSGLGNRLVMHGYDGVNPRVDVQSTNAVPDAENTHVAVTFNGTSYQTYINGVADGNAVTDNAVAASSDNYIGRQGSSGTYLSGEVPVLKIYNQALSADEIKRNYNAYKNRFNL